jgi:hypothetical protein
LVRAPIIEDCVKIIRLFVTHFDIPRVILITVKTCS